MSSEFDSFISPLFGDFVESAAGDRGGKTSQFTDIIVNDAGLDADFTPIILIISNAIGFTQEDDPQRSLGYQFAPNLESDLSLLESVMDAFDRANWDGLGRVRPNLRIGILQPEYVGNLTMWLAVDDTGRNQKRDFVVEYDGGKNMLVAGLDLLQGRVRLYYTTERLSNLRAVDEIEGVLEGPSLPGNALLELWDAMSNGREVGMQNWWTQLGLEQFDVDNFGQFKRGFLSLVSNLVGPRISPASGPNGPWDSIAAFRLGRPNTGFPGAYFAGLDNVNDRTWLLAWGQFSAGNQGNSNSGFPRNFSRVWDLMESIEAEPNVGAPIQLLSSNITDSSYRWVRQLAVLISELIPRG